MPEPNLPNLLNEALEAILISPAAEPPMTSPEIASLLRLAVELRGLPSEDFRARLRAELEQQAERMTSAVTPVRRGFHTITPYLQVGRAAAVLEFVKKAFSADETFRTTGTGGGMHAEARIGDSMLMIGGYEGMPFPEMPTCLHLYVGDADAAYRRALEAGAASMYEPVDQLYGDREAGVKDPGGNIWYIATHRGSGAGQHVPEGLRSVTPYLHARGAARLIDFVKSAFGAEEAQREQSPAGVVHHAKIRIGDSIVEMGDAHGEWQPMPTALYLYVKDVDALYERALEAGATSKGKPADQPYGDRLAHVGDPFGNMWYIATHKRHAKS